MTDKLLIAATSARTPSRGAAAQAARTSRHPEEEGKAEAPNESTEFSPNEARHVR